MKGVPRNLRNGKTAISVLLAHAGATHHLVLMLVMFNLISISASAQSAVALRDSNRQLVVHTTISPSSSGDPSAEYGDLKLSRSVRQLAHWARLSPQTMFHLCLNFNFFLMVALIFWKGWPLLTAALQARSRSILRAIDEAQRFGEEARRRLAEVEKHWAQLDSEIAAIKDRAEAEMKNEEQVLTARTTKDIARIMEYSRFEIEKAAQHTRHELKAFAADLAVSLARHSIRIDEKTDQELVKSLIEGMGRQEFPQTTSEHSGRGIANV